MFLPVGVDSHRIPAAVTLIVLFYCGFSRRLN